MISGESLETVTVYGLSSSRNGELRYVGQTVQRLRNRLRQHLHSPKRALTPVAKWIKREVSQGYSISITPIEENAPLHSAEIAWIAKFRSEGARLLNITEGGEGTLGFSHSGRKRPDLAERNRLMRGKPGRKSTPEINAKIAAAHRGKKSPWLSERNRSLAGIPGRKHTEASREKIGAAHKGKDVAEETRRKISEKARARPMTPERLEQLAKAREARFERKNVYPSIQP